MAEDPSTVGSQGLDGVAVLLWERAPLPAVDRLPDRRVLVPTSRNDAYSTNEDLAHPVADRALGTDHGGSLPSLTVHGCPGSRRGCARRPSTADRRCAAGRAGQ